MSAGVVVVIPAYNAASFITSTLAGVAAQTLVPSEVVLVDDGSTDTTVTLADAWSDLLPLRIVRQQNLGPAAARRHGLATTAAPVVALLDADDIWLPDHLQTLVAAYEATGGIISANAIRWRPGSPRRMVTHARRLPVPPAEAQPVEILRRNFVFVSSVFARDDYARAGGFRDGWSGAEDWDLWIRMIRQGIRVIGVKQPTCLYRLVPTSLSHGDVIHERYLAVLEQAKRETEAANENVILDQSIRRCRAQIQIGRALVAGNAGQYGLARREAFPALGGSLAVSSEAAAMLLAPRTACSAYRIITRIRWG